MYEIFLHVFLIILISSTLIIFFKFRALQVLYLKKDLELSHKIEKINNQSTMLEMQNRLTEAYAMDVEASRFELTAALDKLDKSNEALVKFNTTLQEEVDRRTAAIKIQNSKILQYAFINAHKTRAPLARLMGLTNIILYTYANGNNLEEEVINYLLKASKELDSVLFEAQNILSEGEFEEI